MDHLSVEAVERALVEACRRGHADVVAFTVAPCEPSARCRRGGHDWFIEFGEPPGAPEVFVHVLEDSLQRGDATYRQRRGASGDLGRPRVLEVAAGTFERWARDRSRRGEAPAPPRVIHDRALLHALVTVMAARSTYPPIPVGIA